MAELTEHRKDQIDMHRSVADMYIRRTGYAFADDFQKERNAVLMSLAPDDAGSRVVDLGCGTGIMLNHLASRYARVSGIDLSLEMLQGYEKPTGLEGKVSLALGDMSNLPILDQSFDLILCRSALHHMDDEIAVLSEMCRILKPGGTLIVGEPANDFPLFKLARWWVKRRPSFGKIHTIDRAYTRAQLRELFDKSGLCVHRERRFGFIAYAVCDNPELVPVLKVLPAGLARFLGRILRFMDRVLARIPVIKNWSWYTMLDVRRKA